MFVAIRHVILFVFGKAKLLVEGHVFSFALKGRLIAPKVLAEKGQCFHNPVTSKDTRAIKNKRTSQAFDITIFDAVFTKQTYTYHKVKDTKSLIC